MLCDYIQKKEAWPTSRVDLLEYYNRSNYERKMSSGLSSEERTRAMDRTFLYWGRIAYEITNRNMGRDFLTGFGANPGTG